MPPLVPGGAVEVTVADPARPPAGMFDLLCAAFDEPPYEDVPAKMAKRLAAWPDLAATAGFRVVTARRGQALVGLCLGFVDVLGTRDEAALFAGLYARLRDAPYRAELRGGEVVELATAPAERGRGVAASMLEEFLDGGPGWLLADARAPAHDWYLRRGWRLLGPVDEATPYVALARDADPSRDPTRGVTLR